MAKSVPRSVTIIGGGLAGCTTASALRRRGYEGSVVVVADERHLPYDRPPLSKEFLEPDGVPPYLKLDLTAMEVEVRHERAETVTSENSVITDAGREIESEIVVVATGSAPIELPGSGAITLRTLDDAERLRGRLSPSSKLVIVGAGWIGAEVATAACKRGCEVVVVEAAESPLRESLPDELGSLTVAWFEEAGVRLMLGCPAAEANAEGLALSDGRTVEADTVLVAVGVRPDLSCLDGWDVPRGRGLLVDQRLHLEHTSIYAVGDAAEWFSDRAGAHVWFPHWDNAMRSGEALAANLMGSTDHYDPVPYVWSDQFDRKVQMVGRPSSDDDLIWRGRPTERAWSAGWVRGRQLTALYAVDRPRDISQARRLIESRSTVHPAKLADPEVPLNEARSEA